ncbi:hypothetical protein DMN50_05650 [Priestia megaterium]|nr:hypothetical protein DMN50_05650 [Priestia megaterium]
MGRIIDVEEAKRVFLEQGLTPLFSEYKNARTKMKAMNQEGYFVVICLDKLQNKRKPLVVSVFNPYTIENIQRYTSLNAEGYKLLSTEYESSVSKLNWKCNENHEFKMEWTTFNQGSRCPVCAHRASKTNDEFTKEIYNLVENEYTFLDEYIGVDDKIKVVHNTCKHAYEVTPYKFITRKQRCPKCFGTPLKTNERFLAEIQELTGDEYTFMDVYKTAHKELLVQHNKCGNEFFISPHSFINGGQRCPNCRTYESTGEKTIAEFLEKNNINFIRQYKFDDCKSILPLRFDFAVLDNQNNLSYLIEFDGRQHFEAIDYFGGEEYFKEIKRNDSIKNNYCKMNKIKLLRIPYKQQNEIEKILNTYAQ